MWKGEIEEATIVVGNMKRAVEDPLLNLYQNTPLQLIPTNNNLRQRVREARFARPSALSFFQTYPNPSTPSSLEEAQGVIEYITKSMVSLLLAQVEYGRHWTDAGKDLNIKKCAAIMFKFVNDDDKARKIYENDDKGFDSASIPMYEVHKAEWERIKEDSGRRQWAFKRARLAWDTYRDSDGIKDLPDV